MVGKVHFPNKETSKTISSSGGKIHFRTGFAVTWGTSGSTLRVGMQDVATASGPPARGDGTYDVYDDLVQGTDSISVNTWTTATMSTGTKTISHGDLIAIAIEMTVRNGSDSITISGLNQNNILSSFFPLWTTYLGGAYSVAVTEPIALIETDDGTFGVLAGSMIASATGGLSYSSSSSPDEQGLLLTPPGPCTVDGVWVMLSGNNSAAADFTVHLYADPLGTITEVASVAVLGEQISSSTSQGFMFFPFTSNVTLTANTTYWASIEATGTGNVTLAYFDLANAAHRAVLPGGTNMRLGARKDTGSITETTTRIPIMGVRLSGLDDGAGGGGGVGPGILRPNRSFGNRM